MKKLLLSVAALIFATVLLTLDERENVDKNDSQDAIARVEILVQS
ncbi:hypothetical protein [Paucihalobacter ruber]|nr:hypothetical protein [Paucihalobacter ruber]